MPHPIGKDDDSLQEGAGEVLEKLAEDLLQILMEATSLSIQEEFPCNEAWITS